MQAYDAHVHLDFMRNGEEVAQDAQRRGLRLFANTVTPDGFLAARERFGRFDNVDVGLGLHPWWVDRARVEDFERLADKTAWIGEVGLDFSPKRPHHDLQLAVFERIARICAEQGGKTISLHSVRAAGTVLDVLESSGCLRDNACIFHWFSGSTEDLWRAIRAGAWFSVNEMQAGTRRAKEQLRLIPADRLLFETDLPPGKDVLFSAEKIETSLRRARELTTRIRAPR